MVWKIKEERWRNQWSVNTYIKLTKHASAKLLHNWLTAINLIPNDLYNLDMYWRSRAQKCLYICTKLHFWASLSLAGLLFTDITFKYNSFKHQSYCVVSFLGSITCPGQNCMRHCVHNARNGALLRVTNTTCKCKRQLVRWCYFCANAPSWCVD